MPTVCGVDWRHPGGRCPPYLLCKAGGKNNLYGYSMGCVAVALSEPCFPRLTNVFAPKLKNAANAAAD